LIEEVWKGRAVTDNSLVKCIEEVREKLGPAARQYILNVHGRGHIFDKTDEASVRATSVPSEQIDVVRADVVEFVDADAVGFSSSSLAGAKCNARTPRSSRL
jgi:DNA-binding winged helix-turn-helix (wHTH) protein